MLRIRFDYRQALTRFCLAIAVVCWLPLVGTAYTVQMRGGRRIEIPDQFFVTQATLTYETAPALLVTLQLAHIDIAATERLNGEAPGSLLKRAVENEQAVRLKGAAETRAQRTLTNSELEGTKRIRLESERIYEQRRRELSLPTAEESARRAQAAAAALRETTRGYEAEQAEAESYWRARASALRAEIAALDGEIAYLHTRLGESPERSIVGLTSGFLTIQQFPSGGVDGLPAHSRHGARRTSVYSGRNNTQLSANLNFGGGTTRGTAFLQREDARRTLRQRAFPTNGVFIPNSFVFGIPFNYSSATRELLLERLYTLEGVRAGFDERWRLLEEEARRAGALPGWLRQ